MGGITEKGVRLFTDSSWAMGVDLGQSNDFTAISIVERAVTTEVTWKGIETHKSIEYRLRHIERIPLGLPYPAQVSHVISLLARPPLERGCQLAIDDTGAGRPVSDLFIERGLKPLRISITAGDSRSYHGAGRWHVAKSLLVSHLDASLHTGELKIASDLAEANSLREELKDFRRHISTAGRYSYEARAGRNDDLVLSLAVAMFVFVGRPKPPPPAQVFQARLTTS